MTNSPESEPVEILPKRSLALVPTPLRKRAIDLATLNDVRREMCRIYREMRTLEDFPLRDRLISRVGDHLDGVTGGAVGDDS